MDLLNEAVPSEAEDLEYAWVCWQARNAFVAAAFLLYYDYALTWKREVHHYWLHLPNQKHWTWARFLFYSNRYVPLIIAAMNIAVVSQPQPIAFHSVESDYYYSCAFWFKYWLPIGSLVQITLVETIMCQRLYAIYNGDERIRVGALGCLFGMKTCAATVLGFSISRVLGSSPSAVGIAIQACLLDSPRDLIWAAWIPNIVFQIIALGFASFKTYSRMIETRDSADTTKIIQQSLFALMFRNSFLYFSCILLLSLGTCLCYRIGSFTIGHIFQGPSLSLMSIIGSRLFIHSREAREEVFHPEYELESIEMMRFAEAPPPRPRYPLVPCLDEEGNEIDREENETFPDMRSCGGIRNGFIARYHHPALVHQSHPPPDGGITEEPIIEAEAAT